MIDQTLHDILRRYPAACQPATPIIARGGAGGLSGARLWRFRAAAGDLVLRAWPPHGPGQKHREQVHEWLARTADLGFVPVPLKDRAGTTLQQAGGTSWELAPWLPGVYDPACPPAPERLARALAGLAAFHLRLAGWQTLRCSAGLGQRSAEITALVEGELDTLERVIERNAPAAGSVQHAARQWLGLARTFAPSVLSPVRRAAAQLVAVQPAIRDTRPEHFLFVENELTGLVDFGAMDVDSVACDLARLIGTWLDDDAEARRTALESYERVCRLDPVTLELIGVLESANALLNGARWVRWHYIDRRVFDDPGAVARGSSAASRSWSATLQNTPD